MKDLVPFYGFTLELFMTFLTDLYFKGLFTNYSSHFGCYYCNVFADVILNILWHGLNGVFCSNFHTNS